MNLLVLVNVCGLAVFLGVAEVELLVSDLNCGLQQCLDGSLNPDRWHIPSEWFTEV